MISELTPFFWASFKIENHISALEVIPSIQAHYKLHGLVSKSFENYSLDLLYTGRMVVGFIKAYPSMRPVAT